MNSNTLQSIHISFENLVMGEMYTKNKTEISIKDVNEKAKIVHKKLNKQNIYSIIDFGKEYYKDFARDTEMFTCVNNKIILKDEYRLHNIGEFLFRNLDTTKLLALVDFNKKDEIKIAKKITVWFTSHFFI